MEQLIKFTYLLDAKSIKYEIEKLWQRYQEILNNPNWEDLNEARAILYILGNIYCETVVPSAIERRLHLLKKPLSLIEFLSLIDSGSESDEHNTDSMFVKLRELYLVVKEFKNKNKGGGYYLDEERFIELYNKFSPTEEMKIKYKGRFGNQQ